MKTVAFLWMMSVLLICSAHKETLSAVLNLRVQALSPYSLRVTWDPPLVGSAAETVVGYSLVFLPVQSHQKRRTHVELFVNQYNLTNLRPGTRYRIKLGTLIKNGKLGGVYTNWVNARTPEENKTATGLSPGSTVGPPTSYQFPRHCSRITSKLCRNIGYNFTQMPNLFKQQNQVEVEYELSQFTLMIQSNCSPVLRVFLCSLYFPPCTDDPQLITLPCRYVCQKARRDCKLWIERSGLKWPYKFECSSFPEPSKLACLAEDSTITQVENKMPPQCEPLSISMCKGLGYMYVHMPNYFRDKEQKHAKPRLEEFSLLVQTKCSQTLLFFLCLLYVPPCVINMNTRSMIPPCREVCEEARHGCEPIMNRLGFRWPSIMNCTDFPRYNKNELDCLMPKFSVSAVSKVSQDQPRCEPLKIPMCRSLNYTHTILPNFLNQSSQTEIKRTLKELKPYLKSKCSNQLKRFACFFLAPYCTSDGTLLPPCQSFCEKIKTDCGHLSVRLANLNCSIFPTLSRKRLCIGDPLTTMDCVGPHSRPCTVISSTLPIILRCSSREFRFTIEEIIISLYNGTSLPLATTSKALQQCDQNGRQQIDEKHECQFNINYSGLGIDTFWVNSVTVKYHCFMLSP